MAIRLRGVGLELETNYAAAMDAYRQALELWRTLSPESEHVANALSDLAGVEWLFRDSPAAERDYQEVLRISEKIGDRKGIATYTGNLSALALDRGDWKAADELARDPNTGWPPERWSRV